LIKIDWLIKSGRINKTSFIYPTIFGDHSSIPRSAKTDVFWKDFEPNIGVLTVFQAIFAVIPSN
jgi:hypothetical protein